MINHLLGLESAPQPFDFSVNDELIREPLSNFIPSRNLSVEDILTIEYFPAYSLSEEKQTAETDAWVGCMGMSANKNVLLAGCYDGSLQILPCGSSALKVGNKITAHEDPIRSLTLWDSMDGGKATMVATASKDQSVKIWKIEDGKALPKGKKRDVAGAEKETSHSFVQLASLNDHSASVEALAYYTNMQASVRDMLFLGTGQVTSLHGTFRQSTGPQEKWEKSP